MWQVGRQIRTTLVVQISITILLATASAAKESHLLTAKSAILIHADSGVTLWSHKPDLKLPPASTTKVITAMLALESDRLGESFKVSKSAAAEPPSKIQLRAGWEVELRDLVFAILLNSANDASVAIAEGLSGSVSSFAKAMNREAKSLGAKNSFFVNPNGLPDKRHRSTARDLATLFGAALEKPGFRDIISTHSGWIKPKKGSSKRIRLRNKNRMLKEKEIAVIGKTGWTRAAKKCFVGSARVGDRELLFAILGSDDLWGDIRKLISFGFDKEKAPPKRIDRDPLLQLAAEAAAAPRSDSKQVARYVKIASFGSQSKAKHLRDKIAKAGHPVRIFPVEKGDKSLFRVAVRSFLPRQASGSKPSTAIAKSTLHRANPPAKKLSDRAVASAAR